MCCPFSLFPCLDQRDPVVRAVLKEFRFKSFLHTACIPRSGRGVQACPGWPACTPMAFVSAPVCERAGFAPSGSISQYAMTDIFTVITILSSKLLPGGKRAPMNAQGACALSCSCCVKPREPGFQLYLSFGFASGMQITISILYKVGCGFS